MCVAFSHPSIRFRSQTKDLKKKIKKQSTKQEILITEKKRSPLKEVIGLRGYYGKKHSADL